jgi:leucyl/phenylalanyl-tRNA--protein transferase
MEAPPPLTPDLLLRAYSVGLFPMADAQTGEICWYSPDRRAVIPIERYVPPRSLRQVIRRRVFQVRIDTAFEAVMWGCAAPRRGDDRTWISEEMIAAYAALHRAGFAHSVETYLEDRLVGGLYGVAIGGAFFGESMFYRMPNASRVAFHALVERLRERGYVLLDTQFLNPHVERLGAVEIPRAAYLRRLKAAIARPASFI